MRNTLEIAPKPPAASLASRLLARYSALTFVQRPLSCGTMPMATSASELRRLDSSMVVRDWASWAAVRVGLSTSHSVSTVRTIRTKAPIVAVIPIQKWKAKQMPR